MNDQTYIHTYIPCMAHLPTQTRTEKGWATWEHGLLGGGVAGGMPDQIDVSWFGEAPGFHPTGGNFEAASSCCEENCPRNSSRVPRCHIYWFGPRPAVGGFSTLDTRLEMAMNRIILPQPNMMNMCSRLYCTSNSAHSRNSKWTTGTIASYLIDFVKLCIAGWVGGIPVSSIAGFMYTLQTRSVCQALIHPIH